MEWDQNLYIGESIRHRQNKVKWKIMHNLWQNHIYVISLASNENNLLDIVPAGNLLQKHYPKEKMYVVGLAGNYEEAIELAGCIVSEVYRLTGDFDVRGHIRQKG